MLQDAAKNFIQMVKDSASKSFPIAAVTLASTFTPVQFNVTVFSGFLLALIGIYLNRPIRVVGGEHEFFIYLKAFFVLVYCFIIVPDLPMWEKFLFVLVGACIIFYGAPALYNYWQRRGSTATVEDQNERYKESQQTVDEYGMQDDRATAEPESDKDDK